MLEVNAHNHLKKVLDSDACAWHHSLTLSRLVGRSLRRGDNSLFQLDIDKSDSFLLSLLIPLCIDPSGAVLILSDQEKRDLFECELPRLIDKGFHLSFYEGSSPPSTQEVWILDHFGFCNAFKNGMIRDRQLIVPSADLLIPFLRKAMAFKIRSSDWEELRQDNFGNDSLILKFYEQLTRKLFRQPVRSGLQKRIESSDMKHLIDLLQRIDAPSPPWSSVLEISNVLANWTSWGEINHPNQNLAWQWYWQPLEPLSDFQGLFEHCSMLMLSRSLRNQILLSQLDSIGFPLKVNVTLRGHNHLDPLLLFLPYGQPLPNDKNFLGHLLEVSRRLIFRRYGLTIVFLDDASLGLQLASALAAEFGKRIVFEEISLAPNGVICCSCKWWLLHQDQLPNPDQIIFTSIPFPSLESPLIAAKVDMLKQQGRDWFREFLLPEALMMISNVILGVQQRGSLRVAILDGRVRVRSWGLDVLRSLEPWAELDRLMPH